MTAPSRPSIRPSASSPISAIEDFDQAIRLQPNYPFALRNRGDVYNHKGHYDRAIEDYDQAIRLQPNYPDAFNNRGLAYKHLDQNDLAISDFDQAIRLKPDFAEAWNGRCSVRAILGQLTQALPDCNQSLSLQPKDANTLGNRGFTYLKMGNLAFAVADYNAALAINPKLADSLYGRGLAERISDPAKARSDVMAALAIDPQVGANFRKWQVTLAPPDGLPASATITATLSGEILEALEKTPSYRTITELYDRNKGNPAWLKSEQGVAAARLQQMMRSDAAAIALVGPKDEPLVQYSVRGEKVSDANIRASDLERDPRFRQSVVLLIAETIGEHVQEDVKKVLDPAITATPPLAAQTGSPAARAAARYQECCDAGNPRDCVHLAEAYSAGDGVTKNGDKEKALLERAIDIFQKACDGGAVVACLNAGNMWMKYADNSDSANPLYRKACDGGNATGCLHLGEAYEFGHGLHGDNAQAVSFYQKACDGGQPSGCLKAGEMYEGLFPPVPEDRARVNALYRKACDGHKIATDEQYDSVVNADIAHGCEFLGYAYKYGRGAPIDTAQAAALFRKACDLGDSGGCDGLKELGQH